MPARRGRRILVVGTVLLAGAAVTGEARAAGGSTAGLKLPPVEVKLPAVEVKLPVVEVKVPPVQVNLSPVEAQVPSVEVKLPPVEVKLPPVDVKLPPVEAALPPVDVKVPQVDVPAPPRNPDSPASAAPRAPSGSGAAPASTPARGQDDTARETSAAAASGPATSGPPAAGGGGARGGAAARRDPAFPTRLTRADPRGDRALPPARRRREERLRQLVRSLGGCLGALPSIERRVLTLRAGGAADPPLSRRQVARRLDVGLQRVAAVERRGLDRLREQARAGGCAGEPVSAVAAAPTDTGGATPASTTPAASSPARSESRGRSGVVEAVKRSLGAAIAPDRTPSELLTQSNRPPLLALLIGAFLVGFAVTWVHGSRGVARRPAPYG